MTSTPTPVAGLTTRPATGTTWRTDTPCAQTDPDLWFPEAGRVPAAAITICMSCDVRRPCLEWALRNHERGVWGGTTDRERRAMLRAQTGQPVVLDAAAVVRDARILDLTEEGLSARQIAEELGCATRTVTRVRVRSGARKGVAA